MISDITHLFWTRIAVETAAINPRLPERSRTEHERACRLWLDRSSRFYEAQTVDAPFKVGLAYSDSLADVVWSFQWPSYVELATIPSWEWWRENAPAGERATFHRVDADDSYSVDLFDYLDRSCDYPTRQHILYYWHRQFDMKSNRLTVPLRSNAPNFSGVYWPSVPDYSKVEMDRAARIAEVFGVEGNHGRFTASPHVEAQGCYALLRITGINAVNQLGTLMRGMAVPEFETELDPRFVGY